MKTRTKKPLAAEDHEVMKKRLMKRKAVREAYEVEKSKEKSPGKSAAEKAAWFPSETSDMLQKGVYQSQKLVTV